MLSGNFSKKIALEIVSGTREIVFFFHVCTAGVDVVTEQLL